MRTFSHRVGSSLTTEYVELSESTYPGGRVQPTHGHAPAYFTTVIDGGYDERVGSEARELAAGSVLVHPSGEEHAVRFLARTTRIFRLTPRDELLQAARLVGTSFCAARYAAVVATIPRRNDSTSS